MDLKKHDLTPYPANRPLFNVFIFLNLYHCKLLVFWRWKQ